MQRRTLLAAGGALLAAPRLARAQGANAAWPTRPIRLIVTWPPGGTTDILARQIQPQLAAALGQSVIIENKGGASGAIGTAELARASNDGHTFGMVTSTIISMPLMKPQPFDPIRDFTPILLHSRVANIMVVNPALKANTPAEVVALSKEKPGGLSFGSAGIGSAVHISGEMFKLATGANMTHVPYRGGGPALADLAGGSLDLIFGNASSTLPFVRDGRVRALAVTSANRAPYLPELPTLAETGLTGFAIDEWYGCLGPANMNPVAVQKLHQAMLSIISAPAERQKLLDGGAEVAGGTPEDFGALMREDLDKIGRVVREAKITLD